VGGSREIRQRAEGSGGSLVSLGLENYEEGYLRALQTLLLKNWLVEALTVQEIPYRGSG